MNEVTNRHLAGLLDRQPLKVGLRAIDRWTMSVEIASLWDAI